MARLRAAFSPETGRRVRRRRQPFAGKYRPETTSNYELGFKSTLSDRLRFNAAVFYIQIPGSTVSNRRVARPTNSFKSPQNIGPSHNYGGEFDVSARLTQELLFTTSFGVTKAVWGNVPYYDLDLNQPTNLIGRTAPYTPAYQGSVSLDWSHHLTEKLLFGARADSSSSDSSIGIPLIITNSRPTNSSIRA